MPHRSLARADAAVRRALVRADEGATDRQDVADAAALLAAMGLDEPASLLARVLRLEDGLPGRATGTGNPMAQAAAELRALAALPWTPPPARDPAEALAPITLPTLPPADAAPPRGVDVARLAADLDALVDALDGGTAGAMEAALARVAPRRALTPHVLSDRYAQVDTAQLAAMLAANRLRALLEARHALAEAPLGTPALFAAAGRLPPGGLGPWLSGVPGLIRTPRDIPALTALAGVRDPVVAGRLAVLAAARLDVHGLVGLADALGDLGLVDGLGWLLDMGVRQGRRGYVFNAIRDAALDLRQPALAAAAQRRIVLVDRQNVLELLVLADVQVTAGAEAAGAAALREALRIRPGDADAGRRLRALERGTYDAWRATRGYASPPNRTTRRRLHAAAA